jgi:glycine/D-amino acid oxidase-like deaminating enzyme
VRDEDRTIRPIEQVMAMRRIAVLGAGIVGAAVAERLSVRAGCTVTVIDAGGRGQLPGSTGHAPGFVGVLGDHPVLTRLALDSVDVYRKLEWHGQTCFDAVGALELAQGQEAAESLARRARAAAEAGIPANLLDPEDAERLAPRLVDSARIRLALHLPADGTARARAITAALGARAAAAGVRFAWDAKVTGVDVRGGRVTAVRTVNDVLAVDDVVIACGLWGPLVADLAGVALPLVPIAHPYVYSATRRATQAPAPIVRWPEHSVYAGDHGSRDGLGTAKHDPVTALAADRAELPWPGRPFDDAVAAAMALLPPRYRWRPAERLNGVLSKTPDMMPLLGSFARLRGLWAAEAIWVTHAAGAAQALVAQMFDEPALTGPLDPERFAKPRVRPAATR